MSSSIWASRRADIKSAGRFRSSGSRFTWTPIVNGDSQHSRAGHVTASGERGRIAYSDRRLNCRLSEAQSGGETDPRLQSNPGYHVRKLIHHILAELRRETQRTA